MSKQSCAIKLETEVSEEAANTLDGQSRICNWLYNFLAEQALELKSTFIQSQDPVVARTLFEPRPFLPP